MARLQSTSIRRASCVRTLKQPALKPTFKPFSSAQKLTVNWTKLHYR